MVILGYTKPYKFMIDGMTMAEMLIRALILGTDKLKNCKNTHIGIWCWEDVYLLEDNPDTEYKGNKGNDMYRGSV